MQSNDRVSTTASEGGRKSSKPIMEKRRRARINASLAELKSLLLEAIRKEGARHNKMEKADILEMAVKHLRQIHRQQFTGESVGDAPTSSTQAARYHLGFQACAQEVSRYLGQSNSDEEVELKTRLLNHLANCVTNDVFSSSNLSNSLDSDKKPHPVASPANNLQKISVLPTTLFSSSLSSLSTPVLASAASVAPSQSGSHILSSSSPSLSLPTSIAGLPLAKLFTTNATPNIQQNGPSVTSGAPAPVFIPIPVSPASCGLPTTHLQGKEGTPVKYISMQTRAENEINTEMQTVRLGERFLVDRKATDNLNEPQTISTMPVANNCTIPVALFGTQSNLNILSPKTLSNNSTTTFTKSEDDNPDGQKIEQGVDHDSRTSTLEINNNNNVNLNTNNINPCDTKDTRNTVNVPTHQVMNFNNTSQPTMTLQQPHLLHILQQQLTSPQTANNRQVGNVEGNRSSESSNANNNMYITATNDNNPTDTKTLTVNSCLLPNLNQLQLIPTKTASGEIAFVLSTASIIHQPQATNANQALNAGTTSVQLLQPTAPQESYSTSMPPPLTTATPRRPSVSLSAKSPSRDQNPPVSPGYFDMKAIRESVRSHEMQGMPSHSPDKVHMKAEPTATGSQAPVTVVEQDQAMPLNLSAEKSPPQALELVQSREQAEQDVLSRRRLTFSNYNSQPNISENTFRAPTTTTNLQTSFPHRNSTNEALSKSTSEPFDVSGTTNDNFCSSGIVDNDKSRHSTSQPSRLSRALNFKQTPSVAPTAPFLTLSSNDQPPVAFVNPHCYTESGSGAAIRREIVPSGNDDVEMTSEIHSPPVAHCSFIRDGQEHVIQRAGDRGVEAGQPWRHQRGKTLFRPW